MLAFVLLCACGTTTTQVRPIDPYTYTVTGRALSAEADHAGAAKDAASSYCEKRGKHMLTTEREVSVRPDGYPETTLLFECLTADEVPAASDVEVPASAADDQ